VTQLKPLFVNHATPVIIWTPIKNALLTNAHVQTVTEQSAHLVHQMAQLIVLHAIPVILAVVACVISVRLAILGITLLVMYAPTGQSVAIGLPAAMANTSVVVQTQFSPDYVPQERTLIAGTMEIGSIQKSIAVMLRPILMLFAADGKVTMEITVCSKAVRNTHPS